MSSELLTIGKLASLAGLTPDTLRYYERLGPVPPPPRTARRHPLHEPSLVPRIGFVPQAPALRLSPQGVREILLQDTPPDAIVGAIRRLVAERGPK